MKIVHRPRTRLSTYKPITCFLAPFRHEAIDSASGTLRHLQSSTQRFYLSRWLYTQVDNVKNVDFLRFVYLRQHQYHEQKNASMVSVTAEGTCINSSRIASAKGMRDSRTIIK
ncbi:hypothetical protein BIFDEN_01056 [Bifidobacterium dentium ATCC 27678]|nr:hypothetical protein BIFDEN_01056 [Bifidobacterium dentium ATCC 27678]